MSLVNIVGLLGGLAVYLLFRRFTGTAKQLALDELTGRRSAGETARLRFENQRRSFRAGQVVTVFLALLLAAVLGRAAVTGAWGGTTVYYVLVLGGLLAAAGFALWQGYRATERARAALDG